MALSDAGGLIATPLGFIERRGLERDIACILERAREWQAEGMVVGLPLSLNGKVGPQARKVRAFLKALREKTDMTVDTVDERFSTAEAERLLRQAGRQPSRHRGEVDATAAAIILQEYLNQNQLRGRGDS